MNAWGIPSRGSRVRNPLSPSAALRYDVIRRALRGLGQIRTIVEVGCGKGALAVRLAPRVDRYLGYEPDHQSAGTARTAVERVPHAQIAESPLPAPTGERFDLLVACEVLEHQQDDHRALTEWARWVRPEGHLLLSVPSDPARFGAWDVAVGHYRRYLRDDFSRLAEQTGLEVVSVDTYGWPLGLWLEAFRNLVAGRSAAEDTSMDDRTRASGRLLQPRGVLGLGVAIGVLPFRILQALPAFRERGHGLVVLLRRP